ncbi:MAG: hypothetical protein LN412_06575, partial [Candidatus Thermoplasmatota archaeon]|nr:hypothetical protein [Candidatus Thermoplasmatota archaeon]
MAEIQWPFVIAFIAYFVVIWAIAHRVATRIRTYLELSVGGRVVFCLAFAFLVSRLSSAPSPSSGTWPNCT